MEWPELLGLYREMLRQYALWIDNDCEGEPPSLVDASRARGPVPPELAAYAAELAQRTLAVQADIEHRLAELRDRSGHPAPLRPRIDVRPMPRYLDALG